MVATVSLRLDRRELADAVRTSPQFRTFTRDLERKTVRTAQRVADSRVQRRTGDYAGNFETTVTLIRTGVNLARLRLFNSKRHAAIIEDGSRPHTIRPRRARILAFDVGGRRVFTHIVRHPGTKPQHVIRDTLQQIVRGIGL